MTPELAATLGLAAALGFDPCRLLRADAVERPILEAALEHAARHARERDEALAKRIIAELATALKHGRKRG